MSTVQATEVTKPDGSRFISSDPDVEVQARIYPAEQGYSVRLVRGEETAYGFLIARESPTAEPELEAGR